MIQDDTVTNTYNWEIEGEYGTWHWDKCDKPLFQGSIHREDCAILLSQGVHTLKFLFKEPVLLDAILLVPQDITPEELYE